MSVLPHRGNNLATVLISAMCICLLVKQLFSKFTEKHSTTPCLPQSHGMKSLSLIGCLVCCQHWNSKYSLVYVQFAMVL